jgi:broad-specificity NMP kinase
MSEKFHLRPSSSRMDFKFPLALLNLSQRAKRKLTRREFAWLSILYGWSGMLRKELKKNRTILLDQGPIYLFTEVREFGPEFLREKNGEELWQDLYSRWVDSLDTVIWLDAADSELIKRIRSREKGHIVKNESDETVVAFLARYRNAYTRTICNLNINHCGLKILRFNTSQRSPDEIADQLLSEFETARETYHEKTR